MTKDDPSADASRRRYLEAVEQLDDKTLLVAYKFSRVEYPSIDTRDIAVKAILEGRLLGRIAEETRNLAELTEISATETKRLADSSEKLERLTITLRNLTWALLGLTLVAALVPFAIEFLKPMFEPISQITVEYPPHPSPTLPTGPPHQ